MNRNQVHQVVKALEASQIWQKMALEYLSKWEGKEWASHSREEWHQRMNLKEFLVPLNRGQNFGGVKIRLVDGSPRIGYYSESPEEGPAYTIVGWSGRLFLPAGEPLLL